MISAGTLPALFLCRARAAHFWLEYFAGIPSGGGEATCEGEPGGAFVCCEDGNWVFTVGWFGCVTIGVGNVLAATPTSG